MSTNKDHVATGVVIIIFCDCQSDDGVTLLDEEPLQQVPALALCVLK